MEEAPRSFQDIVRRRQRAGFVGREGERAFFLNNLVLSSNDDARRFLFAIHGDGGVGKTFLLTRLRNAATEQRWLTAGTDESSYGVVEVMAEIAQQLEGQSARMKRFTQRHSVYRQRRHELETDSAPEEGIASLATKAVVRVALDTATATIPGGSIVAKAVDSAAVADNVDRLRSGALQKRYKQDDVRLLTSPEEELTPLFLEGLYQLRRPLALFFDTYERTSSYLDSWLRDVLMGRYGDAPPDMIITIAGRHPLNASRWADFFGLLVDMPLAAFTDVEARQVLADKGIVDEQVIEVILAVSGGLPLAVAMLAEQGPTAPEALHDPSGSLVERFLQWEDDPARRALALAAALPRQVSRDLVAALLPDEAADTADLYAWLHGQSFVTQTVSGCRYHDLVREPMIRLSRNQSRQEWQKSHRRLAHTYMEWREGIGQSDKSQRSDETWQNHLLEECYHRLCADSMAALPEVIDLVVGPHGEGPKSVRRWVDMVVQAGRDTDAVLLATWGQKLQTILDAEGGDLSPFLDDLLRQPWFPSGSKKHAYRVRGYQHYLADRYTEAIADFTMAIDLDSEYTWVVSRRGESYRLMNRHEEALADLNAAINLDSENSWAIASRGETYRFLGRYEEALADFNVAIGLAPEYAWAIASRGRTYRLMGRYEEALADFTTVIDLDSEYDWAIASRGDIYWFLGRYEEALADFNVAIGLAPEYAWAIASRGETYRLMGRREEALADFTTAIGFASEYDWAIASRGQTYQAMGRYEEALADFDTAIGLDPRYAWMFDSRGETYRLMGRYEEALADFTTSIGLDSEYAWAIASRGQTYQAMGRYEEALADFTTAIGLGSEYAWVFSSRGASYQAMGQYEKALADFDMAISLDPNDPSDRLVRAMIRDESVINGDRYQWVADPETSPPESRALAQRVVDWLVSEGVISAEKTATDIYLPGSQYATEQGNVSPTGGTRRLTIHYERVICHPMTADFLICPNCEYRLPLRKDGLPTRTWSEVIDLADCWSYYRPTQRECVSCGQGAQLQDWLFDTPWVFCNFAICLWNWEPLDLAFVDRLSAHLGRPLIHVPVRDDG
ncbi:tetratricopeptide repeat protein [Streptosporangium sp. CA-115845]|uniref:tetratricopeptide repeat protein n=1 Tax=Streptosporangium sp. CA-115845 TaxID=3240071 RepID=UPI003D936144